MFHFIKLYLQKRQTRTSIHILRNSLSLIRVIAPDLPKEIGKIFAIFYREVESKRVNYDDLNYEGQTKFFSKTDDSVKSDKQLHELFLNIFTFVIAIKF